MVNLYRRSILGITGAGSIERWVRRHGFRFGVGRFVAGEDLRQAMRVLASLREQGFMSILDLLGEFVDSREDVADIVQAILLTMDALADSDLDRHMSVKPTQLGLGIDYDLALGNAAAIAARAARAGAHLCLDMENHPYTQATLDLFGELRQQGFSNVSTVLQSYLHRTPADIRAIAADHPGVRVRLVKGAYREPATVAWQDSATIHERFLDMLDVALEAGMHVAIATHDERLISESLERITAAGTAGGHEVQMLYGIKTKLQSRLVRENHPVRIYVPYGHDWYGYFSRRLAERPANLGVVVKGLFG